MVGLRISQQRLIAPLGRVYLVAVPENNPLGIVAEMDGRGFDGEVSRPAQLAAFRSS